MRNSSVYNFPCDCELKYICHSQRSNTNTQLAQPSNLIGWTFFDEQTQL